MQVTKTMVALAGVAAIACGSRNTQGVRVFSPFCDRQTELESTMSSQMRFLDQTLSSTGLNLEPLDAPTTTAFFDGIRRIRTGWFVLSYTGHGNRPQNASSQICLAADRSTRLDASSAPANMSSHISINEQVLTALPSTLSGATFILDACQSAQVDPRLAAIPVSIISSAPYVVDATSLFGDRLALALSDAIVDPNCDGLVTDQELFDALLRNVYNDVSAADNRMYPKLRRNASSHIPLPLEPEPRKECQHVREDIRKLAQSNAGTWTILARALLAQLALEPLTSGKQYLPECSRDFFFVEPNSNNQDLLRRAAEKVQLRDFPDKRPEVAQKVARFAIFAEVYSLSSQCDWVSITRLRDGVLMATQHIANLNLEILSRRRLSQRRAVSESATDDEKTRCQYRYLRTAPVQLTNPVHCSEPDGQCFLEPCSESGGS